MENFVWRTEVLPLISAHVTTGEPLPADVLQRLLGTRTFNAALDTLRQIELASFDFELHANFDPAAGARVARDPRAACGSAWRSRRRRRSIACRRASRTSSPAATRRATTATSGPRCSRRTRSRPSRRPACSTPRPRRRFLDSILARGGSLDAMDAFVRFRGRQPDVRPLLKQNRHRRVKGAAPQWLAATAMLLTCVSGRAATAYVSDELVLDVYSDQNQQGQRLATLHSGASVETLATSGEYTQVRLGDGVTGWVKTSYPDHERAGHRAGQAAGGGARSQPGDHARAGRGGGAQRAGAPAARARGHAIAVGRGPCRRGAISGRGRGASGGAAIVRRGQRGDRRCAGRGAAGFGSDMPRSRGASGANSAASRFIETRRKLRVWRESSPRRRL